MAQGESTWQLLLYVKNDAYPASLEVRKVYQVLSDPIAAVRGFVRVIDKSGEDYLYASNDFVAVELPQAVASALAGAS